MAKKSELSPSALQFDFMLNTMNVAMKSVKETYHLMGDKVIFFPKANSEWVFPTLFVPNRDNWMKDVYGSFDANRFATIFDSAKKDKSLIGGAILESDEDNFTLRWEKVRDGKGFKMNFPLSEQAHEDYSKIDSLLKHFKKLPKEALKRYQLSNEELNYIKSNDFPTLFFCHDGTVSMSLENLVHDVPADSIVNRLIFDKKCFLRLTAKDTVSFSIDTREGEVSYIQMDILSKKYYVKEFIKCVRI